ncbi:MAG: hypothetical protein HC904_08675 [Blastochloris sp.]|nr:hypothetical protein [Blastochloris sp.]
MVAEAGDEALQTGSDFLRSRHHEIKFDSKTGRVSALLDRVQGRVLLPEWSRWAWAEPVAEVLESQRHADASTQSFLNGTRVMTAGQFAAESHFSKVEHRGSSVWLIRRHELITGHRVESQIGLCSGSDEVAVVWKVHLNDYANPNGIYAAFPTRLAGGWRAFFNTAGVEVEFDVGQLPGACRDFVTTEHSVALREGEQSWTLRCPDAPLVMLNGFHYGKKLTALPDRLPEPFLLGWVYNNYWGTNFPASEPGSFELHWGLRWESSSEGKPPLPWEQEVLLHPVHEGGNPG